MNEQTSKVKLRPICTEDADVLMELNNSKEIAFYVVGNPQTVNMEQQLAWMAGIAREKNTVRWMVDFDGSPVGTVMISGIDAANGVGNMNVKVLPAHQRKGVAKQALMMACNLAFEELKLECLTANILSYNTASYKLFQKIGFRQDGILRSRVVKNGERYDLLALSLLKTERKYENDA